MKFFTLTILAMVSGALAMPVAAPDNGYISYAGLEGGAKPHAGPYKPDPNSAVERTEIAAPHSERHVQKNFIMLWQEA
ncbi:unnamed protein product [Fusarium fujikuroi]|nr:unnamed protein product [Fusarium fujikuroi]